MSAMVLEDSHYRIALVIVIFALFGVTMGRLIDLDDREKGPGREKAVSTFSDAVNDIERSEPGSTILIDIGTDLNEDKSALSLHFDHYGSEIRVLPGMIVLEGDQRRDIISRIGSITPAFLPGDTGVTESMRGQLTGYSISVPCLLRMTRTSTGVFVFPEPQDEYLRPLEGIRDDLEEISKGPVVPTPGWRMDLDIPADQVHDLRPPFILLSTSSYLFETGTCPLPFFMGPYDVTEKDGMVDTLSVKGEVRTGDHGYPEYKISVEGI